MKLAKLTGIALLVMAMVFGAFGPAMAKEKLIKVPTCWMPEHETFIAWYAKEKGWDKDEGLDMELLYFDSGMAQLEALPARQWVLGATGGVPQVMGSLRFNAYMIGQGNNESHANAVFVRPDSPVLKTKGWNKDNPDVYGKPEDIKGKTILVTTVSSVHYAMSSWLKVFGLKDSDVTVKHMDQASIMAAFESGVGDMACIWAPYSYTAEDKGWKIAGDVASCGAALTITLVGDKKYCDENPEVVAKFLRIFLRGVNMLKKEGSSPEMVKLYRKFYQEWAGMELTPEMAKKDIDMHPVWDLDEQLVLFDKSKGQNPGESESERWQRLIAEFFAGQGKIKPAELKKVNEMGYITDKFLKMVETPIPDYK